MNDKGQIHNMSELAHMLGVTRNTLMSWTKRGCPYISEANRSKGIEWQLSTAEVAQWCLEKAVSDAIGDMSETDGSELRKSKLAAETVIAKNFCRASALHSRVAGEWIEL